MQLNIRNLMIKFIPVFCAILLIAIDSAPANAAQEDVFVVPRVPVQAKAETARQAKNLAQILGRRRSMDILLRRLTPESDWVYLPRLSTRGAAPANGSPSGKQAITLSDSQLEALESGFEVYGEKSSSTTYRAYITFRFKPAEIRRLLKEARLPYSETQTRTALVLPVLQTDSGLYLWEKKNPWMAAWKARPYTHELTPMTAPLGDLDDSRLITARGALAINQNAIANVANHYGVSQVIVAHARLRQEDGLDKLSVRLINGFSESANTPVTDDFTSDANGYGTDGTIGVAGSNGQDFSADVGDVLATAYVTEQSGQFSSLAERGIEASIGKYSSEWKDITLIDHAAEELLSVSVFFSSVDEWSRIRAGLIATPLVGAVQVSSLSRTGAEMDVRVFGDPSRLRVTMENQGVVFWNEGGERWFLATPNVAKQIQGTRFLKPKRRGLFGEEDTSVDENLPIPVSQQGAPRVPSHFGQDD